MPWAVCRETRQFVSDGGEQLTFFKRLYTRNPLLVLACHNQLARLRLQTAEVTLDMCRKCRLPHV